MSTLKVCLKTIVYVVYGGLSAFYTPTFLLLSFNFMHGIANNPDGEVLMPFGIITLLAFLIIDILIILRTIASKTMTKTQKAVVLSLFVAAILVGSLMFEQNDWGFFWECFEWKITH